MPPTVKPVPRAIASFARVSVVMIASAAVEPPQRESCSDALRTPASTLSIGSGWPMTPVERIEHLLRRDAEHPAGLGRGRARVGDALHARRRVGDAGVDDDRLRLRQLEMLARDDDRRRLHAVRGEHAGARGGLERADEREVAAAVLADAAVDAARRRSPLAAVTLMTQTELRCELGGRAVSSSPRARFAFCSAWPAAPLPRLSSAQTTTARPVARSSKSAISAASVCCTRASSGATPSGSTRTTWLPAYASSSSPRRSPPSGRT